MNDVARGSLMLASITLQNVSEAPSGISRGFLNNVLARICDILAEIVETDGNPEKSKIDEIFDDIKKEVTAEAHRHGFE